MHKSNCRPPSSVIVAQHNNIEIRNLESDELVRGLNSGIVFGDEIGWGATLSLSQDGKVLASMRADGLVNLFDMEENMPIGGPIWGPEGNVNGDWANSQALAFSANGNLLAVARDKNIVLLDVELASWKRKACRTANRNLSQIEWDRYVGTDIPYEKTCPELP